MTHKPLPGAFWLSPASLLCGQGIHEQGEPGAFEKVPYQGGRETVGKAIQGDANR